MFEGVAAAVLAVGIAASAASRTVYVVAGPVVAGAVVHESPPESDGGSPAAKTAVTRTRVSHGGTAEDVVAGARFELATFSE